MLRPLFVSALSIFCLSPAIAQCDLATWSPDPPVSGLASSIWGPGPVVVTSDQYVTGNLTVDISVAFQGTPPAWTRT